jgi:hypothetical protein
MARSQKVSTIFLEDGWKTLSHFSWGKVSGREMVWSHHRREIQGAVRAERGREMGLTCFYVPPMVVRWSAGELSEDYRTSGARGRQGSTLDWRVPAGFFFKGKKRISPAWVSGPSAPPLEPLGLSQASSQ